MTSIFSSATLAIATQKCMQVSLSTCLGYLGQCNTNRHACRMHGLLASATFALGWCNTNTNACRMHGLFASATLAGATQIGIHARCAGLFASATLAGATQARMQDVVFLPQLPWIVQNK